MNQYKLYKNRVGEVVCVLKDSMAIPFAPDNTDYQAYHNWVAEGGVPTPADE